MPEIPKPWGAQPDVSLPPSGLPANAGELSPTADLTGLANLGLGGGAELPGSGEPAGEPRPDITRPPEPTREESEGFYVATAEVTQQEIARGLGCVSVVHEVPPDSPTGPEAADTDPESQEVKGLLGTKVQLNEHNLPDWSGTAEKLLGEASTAEGAEKDKLLVGSAVASHLAYSKDDREQYLRTVFEQGQDEALANACGRSGIAVDTEVSTPLSGEITEERKIGLQWVRDLAGILDMGKEKVLGYLDKTHMGSQPGVEEPSVVETQREMAAQLKEGPANPELQSKAEAASASGEKVGGVLVDVHKLERFALQGEFIDAQAAVVLGPSPTDTPLGQELVAARGQGIQADSYFTEDHTSELFGDDSPQLTEDLTKLRIDADVAFSKLSEEVREKFAIEDTGTRGPVSLSREQRINLRFRQIAADTQNYKAIGRYLDRQEFDYAEANSAVPDDMSDVWELANNGAAVPTVAEEAIAVTINAARQPDAPSATPDELADVTQRNRPALIQLAKRNIQEFTQQTSVLDDEVRLVRDESGKLQMKFKDALPEIDSDESYSAATIGCPALNVTVESEGRLTAEQRRTFGSRNYIDRALAVIINEARLRGLFDLRRYGLGPAS